MLFCLSKVVGELTISSLVLHSLDGVNKTVDGGKSISLVSVGIINFFLYYKDLHTVGGAFSSIKYSICPWSRGARPFFRNSARQRRALFNIIIVLGIHTVQNASRDYTCIHSNQLQLYMLCVVSRKVNI